MSNTSDSKSRRDIEARIITKAWKSDSFKQELLSNSKAVIEREFEVNFPEEVTVQVKEENPTTLYFVLPMCTQIKQHEISEEELDSIAGGGIASALFSWAAYVTADAYRKEVNLAVKKTGPIIKKGIDYVKKIF